MAEQDSSDLARELRNAIRATRAYHHDLNWLFLNTLWYEPKYRNVLREVLEKFLLGVTTWTEQHVMLVMDAAASTSALTPLVGGAADKVGCKLAVWREVLPVGLSESWLLPSRLEMGLKCVIVQDVISKGSALRSAAEDIQLVGWEVELIAAIVQDRTPADQFERNLREFREVVSCSPSFKVVSLIDMSEVGRRRWP